MNKILKPTLLIFTLFALVSFRYATEPEIVGTYTVCDSDPSNITLVLNSDFTFTYTDYSNPQKQVNTSGKWEAKNNHILLKEYDSAFSFHTKWRIVNDGKVAKARKGMTFYTLAKA